MNCLYIISIGSHLEDVKRMLEGVEFVKIIEFGDFDTSVHQPNLGLVVSYHEKTTVVLGVEDSGSYMFTKDHDSAREHLLEVLEHYMTKGSF
jgi:hypothetical protein